MTVQSTPWALRIGGTAPDYANSAAIAPDGSVVVAGVFRETATFGERDPNETSFTTGGGGDGFVARYTPDGELLWASAMAVEGASDPNDTCEPRDLTVADDGTIFVAGAFDLTVDFGLDEGGSPVTLTSTGGQDAFMAAYSADGVLYGAKRAGGTASAVVEAIHVLTDGSVLIARCFRDEATFGPGEPNQTVLTSPGAIDWDVSSPVTRPTARSSPSSRPAAARRVKGPESA